MRSKQRRTGYKYPVSPCRPVATQRRAADQMSSSHQTDHLLDQVFYCGLSSGITVLGILGNLLLLIVFYHPSLILHKSLFHSYLRAIAATDLVFLIYNLMYGAFVCQGLSDPPREVKPKKQ